MKLHEARSVEEIEAEIAKLQQELADAKAAQAQVTEPAAEPMTKDKPAATEPAAAPKKKKRKYPYSSIFKWAIEELDYDLPQGQYVKSSKVKQGGSWFSYEVEHSVKQWNGDFKRTPVFQVFVSFDLDTEKWSYSIARPDGLYGFYRKDGSDIKGQGVLALLRSLDRNGVLGKSSKAYFATRKKFNLTESAELVKSPSLFEEFKIYENLWEELSPMGEAQELIAGLEGWSIKETKPIGDNGLQLTCAVADGYYVWSGDYEDEELETLLPDVQEVVDKIEALGIKATIKVHESNWDLVVVELTR